MTDQPAEFPCPGRCNDTFRRAEQTGPDHDVPFTPGQPVWCPACRDRIEHDLDDLYRLAFGLAPGKLNTPRETSTGDSKRTKAASYPSPSPGWDTADELIRWAVQLEDATRRRLGHTQVTSRSAVVFRAPIYGRDWVVPFVEPDPIAEHTNVTVEPKRTLSSALRYLEAWSTAILSDPDTGQLVGEQIQRHKRSLTRLTGTDRLTHRIKGECPVCGARGRLARADGSEVVKCGCGACWPLSHVEHFAKVIADTERVA